jgi:hypothetical protein
MCTYGTQLLTRHHYFVYIVGLSYIVVFTVARVAIVRERVRDVVHRASPNVERRYQSAKILFFCFL